MSHAIRDNGAGYWLRLIWNTTRRYARHRHPLAGARALARTILLGYYGETCNDCGRPYMLWWCDEQALWNEVAGSLIGLLCPNCFDRRARKRGVTLDWTPKRFPAEHRFDPVEFMETTRTTVQPETEER